MCFEKHKNDRIRISIGDRGGKVLIYVLSKINGYSQRLCLNL